MSAAINAATIATTDIIELRFAEWGEHQGGTIYTKTILDGFETWAWDVRAVTLEQLRAEDDQLIADITYMVEQHEDLRELEGIEQAVAEFLDSYREALIETLEDSLADD